MMYLIFPEGIVVNAIVSLSNTDPILFFQDAVPQECSISYKSFWNPSRERIILVETLYIKAA